MPLFGKGRQSSEFDRRSSSQFGRSKPPERSIFPQVGPKRSSSLPQKSFPSKPVIQKPISSKPAPAKPIFTKPSAPKPQKPVPQKPTTLFGQKKDWARGDFLRRATKDSFGSGGRIRSSYEREKILKESLPIGRFGTYISEGEAKTRLRELRSKEYYAKGAERTKLKEMRKNLEKGSGLKDKY